MLWIKNARRDNYYSFQIRHYPQESAHKLAIKRFNTSRDQWGQDCTLISIGNYWEISAEIIAICRTHTQSVFKSLPSTNIQYPLQHTFSMFRTRDESFQLIERLWKITMARLLKWAEVENQTDQSYDSLKNFVVTSMADEDVLTKSRGFLASSHVRFRNNVSKAPCDTCNFRGRTRSCRWTRRCPVFPTVLL